MRLKVRFTVGLDGKETKRLNREEIFVSDGTSERQDAIRSLILEREPTARIVDIAEVDDRLVWGEMPQHLASTMQAR